MQPAVGANTPRHIGIIMDGNGRWAAARGLPRIQGHQAGAENLERIIEHCARRGVAYLTLYFLSTENLAQRPAEEISGLMRLLRRSLAQEKRYNDQNLRLRILGDLSPFDADIRRGVRDIQNRTADNTGMQVSVAINYGGRAEILRAAQNLLHRQSLGEIRDIGSLTEQDFAMGLYTAGMPDVDLVIRTSGEQRISNFLLWQSAYAEYVFPAVYWPDFSPDDLDKAIADFASRSRRMGGI